MISISKRRKIIKILKNWIEKALWGLKKGLNPHSKEKSFSLLKGVFILKDEIIIRIVLKIKNKDMAVILFIFRY